MNLLQAIETLRRHNKWRKGYAGPMVRPELVTLAIDTILEHFENAQKK